MVDTSTNVNINLAIDIHTYENAAALFHLKGTTLKAALHEMIERAAYDEYPTYR
ncbi:MAG: hypothetical protein K2H93_05655 [Oscillospiraceae bacterium]|nr:hypothetical protein [Oscillospiraceae bacterium]